MKSRAVIEQRIIESAHVKLAMLHSCAGAIERVGELVIVALRAGGKVLLCGNGGSAADCQHIAAELVGRFRADRRGMAAIALTTDTSVMTSVGNDFGFNRVFSRQVEAMGRTGDVLIGISTSGRSANVVEAVTLAREMGLLTVAFVGGNGGPVADAAGIVIKVPSSETARIQEAHITVGHIICELVEDGLAAGIGGSKSTSADETGPSQEAQRCRTGC